MTGSIETTSVDPTAEPLLAGSVRLRPRWGLASALFVLAFITTTAFGTGSYLATRTDLITDLWFDPGLLLLGQPEAVLAIVNIPLTVWSSPSLLHIGLMYSLPLMTILLAHELGHYIACRRHGIASTLPYFLPAPFLLGTFGAFIRIRGRIRDRKQLLDVGAAGPIAGFVALLPFLIYGLAHSRVSPIIEVDLDLGTSLLYVPGHSPLSQLLLHLFRLQLGPGTVLDLHPFAFAAWVGLLVTSLNLIPAGQLDGGHILYAISPIWHRRLRPVVVVVLAALGFAWPGWWLWSLIVLLVARRHPPLYHPYEALDRPRRWIAVAALVILIASFMIVPLSIVGVLQ